MRKKPH